MIALALAGDLDHADRAARQALRVPRRRSALPELAGAWLLNAFVAMWRSDLVTAEADARQSVDVARLGGLLAAELILTPTLTIMLVSRGEVEAAAAEFARTGLTEGPILDSPWLMSLPFARGLLRLAQGRPREAAEDFVELHERKQRWGIGGSVMLQAGASAALALAACGERERACELARDDVAAAERWGARARSASRAGRWGSRWAGARAWRRWSSRSNCSTSRRWRGRARWASCTSGSPCATRAAAPTRARRCARRSSSRAAAAPAGIAKQRLRGAAGDRRARAGAGPPIGVESLTPSERRVAQMAADGMTNRQIAQSLFLTVKTIETHLAATYDKLGVRRAASCRRRSRRATADGRHDRGPDRGAGASQCSCPHLLRA